MKTIDNDIKYGQLKNIYLLYGEERYLLRQYRDKLKKAIVSPDDTMNFTAFEGTGLNPKEIIDLAETLPFFAERRLILIENSKLFKKSGEDLADYIGQMPDSTYIVFVEDDVDSKCKLFKEVKKHGSAVEFVTPKEDTLQKWIGKRIAAEGKNITQSTYQRFISKTGTDMENIDKELEKLFCYTMDKEVVEREDIDKVCTNRISNHIFDMVTGERLNQCGNLTIGNHCWIGEGCLLLKNINIEDGCVIGAKSVVTKSTPCNTIMAGNPAKIVKRGVHWERNWTKIENIENLNDLRKV